MRPLRILLPALALAIAAAAAFADSPTIRSSSSSPGLWSFSPDRREAQAALEHRLNDAVSADSLRAFHDHLAARPHRAGTEGDRAVIAYLESQFAEMGLDVETQWLDLYLAKPVSGEVEVKTADGQRTVLSIQEPALTADLSTSDSNLDFGWNAWSGTGDITAEVVYANYGRKQDFERLKQLGVDVTGKIVIARYGGNYRGYKAKFAEAHGAAGLIMYYDPKDVGYARGLMYPDGGWANEHSIQRGSLITLLYEGDALSPGFASVPGAPLLDPKDVALPTIPVQPIGWGAARAILELMDGPVVPEDWQGALPFNYRLTSGPDVKVRLKVEQTREITRTANVLGTIRGAKFPDEFIVVGCHHDAWNHGASDPMAGMMLVLEAARTVAAQAKAGHPPDRSIVFAAWAAEEYGLMGSTEWVEANADRLREHCIAYMNLDMSAMGTSFNAAASPSLTTAIIDATRDVPHCTDTDTPIFDGWSRRSATLTPTIGTMGGGSDHVGFLCVAGVPCMSIGAGGSPGTSYHTNYDTLAWYRKVVGDDYLPAVMLTRTVNLILTRLANADVPPLDPAELGGEAIEHLGALASLAERAGMTTAIDALIDRAAMVRDRAASAREALATALTSNAFSDTDLAAVASALRTLDRAWIGTGLHERPWYKSTFMAPDRDSGYDSWPLPELRAAIEDRDAARLTAAEANIAAALDAIAGAAETIRATAVNASTP
jgi:N-acetylated-alpha-linked acidic dipeptidase